MKFTSTEVRRDSAAVYNQVMKDGMVNITHRDRPEMLLMTHDKLAELTCNAMAFADSMNKSVEKQIELNRFISSGVMARDSADEV